MESTQASWLKGKEKTKHFKFEDHHYEAAYIVEASFDLKESFNFTQLVNASSPKWVTEDLS
jgi:hypothetical protein